MHNEKYVLRIYRAIYVIATLIIGFMTIVTRKMYGEGVGISLRQDTGTLIILLAIDVGMLLLTIPVFNLLKNVRFTISHTGRGHKLVLDQQKIHPFIFIIFILEIVFTLRTGNGVVGNTSQASGTMLSYIFNILKVNAFMPVYYIAARDTKKKLYWINIVLWLIYMILCGWSSTIMLIFFLEFYLRAKYRKSGYNTALLYRASAVIAGVATLAGGFFYKYLFAIKFTIRYGYNVAPLSYSEGLSKLILRFTSFPLAIVSWQNNDRIASLYQAQGVAYADVKSIFRSLVPGSLMNKNFRTLNNIIIQSMYSDVTNTTSSDYPLPLFWMNLIHADLGDFIVYLMITILFLVISKKIIYWFDNGSGDVDILYFFLIFNFMSGYSIESLFGYGYMGLFYFISIMFILGIIKIERVDVNENAVIQNEDLL